MNVGDKDDDLQKEVHTASKIYKNVHSICRCSKYFYPKFQL